MFKFKNFQDYLTEALLPHERKKVDKWTQGDNSFSNHMYEGSSDEHRAHFDLEHPTAGHRSDIEEHIKPHGFEVKDYQKGVAKDKYGRDVNIGRVLHRTKAPDELKKKFENDPSRQQLSAKSDTHKIIISRHPHDVAGMTSHGHSWECESCMNFNTGSRKHHLKHDVKQGTHVAYLVHKDDHNIENPLARIALKRFTNIENPDDHILRPEHKTYGNAPDSFHHTVNKILNKHFPGKEDAIYKKHKDVYDDSGNSHIIGKNAIDKHLDTKDEDLMNALTNHPDLTHEHIDKMLNNKHLRDHHKGMLLTHHNISPETLHKQYEKASKSGDTAAIGYVSMHPKTSHDTLRDIHKNVLNHGSTKYLEHPNLPHDVYEDALKNQTPGHYELGNNPNIPKDLIHKHILHKGVDLITLRNFISNPNSKNLIDSNIARSLYHDTIPTKFHQDNYEHGVARSKLRAKLATLKHTPKDLVEHYLLHDKHDTGDKVHVVKTRKDIDTETLKKVKDLHPEHNELNDYLAYHKNSPDEWFDDKVKSENDPDEMTMHVARGFDKIKGHHIEHILKNLPSDDNIEMLQTHPEFKEEHYKHLYKHKDPSFRYYAINDKKLSSKGIHDFLDSHEAITSGHIPALANHPNLDKSHIKRIMNHPEALKHYVSLLVKNPEAISKHASKDEINKFLINHKDNIDKNFTGFVQHMIENDKISPELLKTYHGHENDSLRKLAKRKSKEYKTKGE